MSSFEATIGLNKTLEAAYNMWNAMQEGERSTSLGCGNSHNINNLVAH